MARLPEGVADLGNVNTRMALQAGQKPEEPRMGLPSPKRLQPTLDDLRELKALDWKCVKFGV